MTWDIPWNGVVPARVIGLKMNGGHLSIPPRGSLGELPGTDKDRAAFPRVAAQYTQLIQQVGLWFACSTLYVIVEQDG